MGTIAPSLSAAPPTRTRTRVSRTVPSDYSYRLAPTVVQVETGYQTNNYMPLPDAVTWTNITEAMDGNDTTATLTVSGLDPEKLTVPGSIGNEHFRHLLEYLRPDRRIRIGLGFNGVGTEIYFVGYPMVNDIAWTGDSQTITCRCTSEADELLSTHPEAMVQGRYMRFDPTLTWDETNPDARLVRSLAPTFNAGLKPNRSQEPVPVTIGGLTQDIYLFVEDDADGAAHWNVANALRYLAYFYLVKHGKFDRIDVLRFFDATERLTGVPQSLSDPFSQSMTTVLEELSVRGSNAKEALWWVCQVTSLHMWFPIKIIASTPSPIPSGVGPDGTTELMIFRSPRDANEAARLPDARVYDLPRQAPYTDQTGKTVTEVIDKNIAGFDASLSIDSKVITAPVFLGAPNRYEVTLLLRPGWKPFQWLDDVGFVNGSMLTGNALKTANNAAMNFWETQFEKGDEWETDANGQYTGVPTSLYHGKHPDHQAVSDVGRLWIFPDSTRYISVTPCDKTVDPNCTDEVDSAWARQQIWTKELYSPYSDDILGRALVYQSHAIGGGIPFLRSVQWTPRNRPFFDTIGRLALATDQSPIVHLTFDAVGDPMKALTDATWSRYNGTPEIDATRAAIRFTDDNLLNTPNLKNNPDVGPNYDDSTMIEAYIKGTFMVAITCTIEGDSRLIQIPNLAVTASQRKRATVIDVADRFRHDNRRGQNSFLNAQPTDEPLYEGRDDTLALQWYALRWRQTMQRSPVAGPFVIPWIDGRYEPGDVFSGVAGLGINFDDYPTIINRVTTNSPDGQATRLVLSDLRQSPEVRNG